MFDDEDFEPRLGRIRNKGAGRARKYLGRILAATALAGGFKITGARRFDGSRIGRGGAVGRVLGQRDPNAPFRSRRAIIKSRIVRLSGKGGAAAAAHLKYIERDGVTREGAPGQLYSADMDNADRKVFLEKAHGDRHQFRFIVSAEDGTEYDDLKPLTRRLMTQIEADLSTKLDWVAVDHYNTGHPHTHIILRGVDDKGQNLIIARNYIAGGMRQRLSELVTLDLGPRTTQDVEAKLRQEISQERLTSIDRNLIRDMDSERTVSAVGRSAFDQSLRAGRLQKLKQLGLAQEAGAGRWQFAKGFDDTLRRISERSDIIRTMQRALSATKRDVVFADHVIHDAVPAPGMRITGRVISRGLADELSDRHYLIIDGSDGRSHYVGIGKGEATAMLPANGIVSITARAHNITDTDRRIAQIAADHDGHYSVDIHLKHDPSASEAFAQSHVRRLEAMRRADNNLLREPDGRWIIVPDHLKQVEAFEASVAKDRPVTVAICSSLPLERLPRFDGATWLDSELVAEKPEALRDAGFGREVKGALAARRQWLLDQGLAQERDGETSYNAGLVATLRRRELLRVAGQLSDEIGLNFVEAKAGTRIEGILKKHIDLASGRFALIERSREFTLVPWRDVLERQVGKTVSGIMRDQGVNWTIGRTRGGLAIS